MYVSSYLTLDTALSGVEAAQEQLDTTGQNIANANAPGYEEQTVNLVQSPALSVPGAGGNGALQLGTGVDATTVTNSGDPYLDAAWRQQNAATNAASTTQTYMQQIQSALNEPNGGGISSQLATFWSDWNALADNPTSSAAQQVVVNQGQSLAQALNTLTNQLNGPDPGQPTDPANAASVLGQVNSQYMAAMQGPSGSGASGGTLYNDAYNIASLNYSIVQAQASGQTANNLIDQRNVALDNLSQLGNVQVQNNSDGSVTVHFGGVTGQALVSDPAGIPPGGPLPPGDQFGSYSTASGTSATGWVAAWQQQFSAAAAAGTSAASLANTVGGTLGALIGLAGYSASGFGGLGTPTGGAGPASYPSPSPATQSGTVGTLTASLNQVTAKLASEVNAPVQSGTGTTYTLNPPFFVNGSTSSTTGITAANIAVSSGFTAPTAAGATYNDVALAEAANAGGAADTAYQSFVQQVGSLAQGANQQETTQSALQTQITNQRTSVEGVDLSQEMANLINEQQAYQASAKVMGAFSTVMTSLMSVVGQ